MILSELPADSTVLIDANIFLYTHLRSSESCYQFVRRCMENYYKSVITGHIMTETMHIFMMSEVKQSGQITRGNPARQLGEKSDVIKSLNKYETAIRDLLGIGIIIEPVIKEDFYEALNLQRMYGLMTNDSIILASAHRLKIRAIASADKAFRQIPTIDLYEPGDL